MIYTFGWRHVWGHENSENEYEYIVRMSGHPKMANTTSQRSIASSIYRVNVGVHLNKNNGLCYNKTRYNNSGDAGTPQAFTYPVCVEGVWVDLYIYIHPDNNLHRQMFEEFVEYLLNFDIDLTNMTEREFYEVHRRLPA